jgi:FlaG/FlaF family flagellin (archaellin)
MVKAYTLKNQLQVESHGCQMPISPNEIDAVSAYPVAGTQPLRSKGISISTEELCESATVIEPTRRIPSPMHNTKTFALASAFILTLAAPALASVTVNSPATGSDVSSPFKLEATASTCSSQGVSSMGYSLDSSSDTTVVDGTEVNATVAAGAGSHTIHVKAWGDKGSSCVEDVTVTVGTAATSTSLVPSDAKSVSSIQAMGNWKASLRPCQRLHKHRQLAFTWRHHAQVRQQVLEQWRRTLQRLFRRR